MGKDQGLGFVDKHIEKVIFLGCLLVMLYVIVQYGLSSSREFGVMGKTAPPGKVDETLLAEAQQIERRYNSQKPKPRDVDDVLGKLEQQQNKPLPSTLAMAMIDLGGLKQPAEGDTKPPPPPESPSLKDIALAMPAPAKPVASLSDEMSVVLVKEDRVEAGRSGVNQTETIRESVSLHAMTSYPYQTLSTTWDKLFTLSGIYPQAVPLAYDVQLQVEGSDGTWSNVKDKFVRLPHPKYGVVKQLTLPEFDGENGELILKEQGEILKGGVAALVFHPDYPMIMTDDVDVPWSSFLTNHSEFVERYFAKEKTVGPDPRNPERPTGPGGLGGLGHVNTPAAAATAAGDAPESELDRKEAALRGPTLPSYDAQIAGDSLLAWAHASDLEYNKKYRIRFRIVFVNPLLTYVRDVDPEHKKGEPIPADAKTPTVATAWSEWSDPMQVREQLDFFVTGENANRKQLTVTIFAKKFGQRIQCTVREVVPGRAIRGSEQVEVLNPLTGEVHRVGADLPTFTFDTGAVAVECRFDGQAFTDGGSQKRGIAELTLADRDGKLHKRLIYVDRNSAEYRRLKEEVKATQARLRGEVSNTDPSGRKLTPKERYLQRKERRRMERQRRIDASRRPTGDDPDSERDNMDRYRNYPRDSDPRRDPRRDDDRRR